LQRTTPSPEGEGGVVSPPIIMGVGLTGES
jgi:hypothetical protein